MRNRAYRTNLFDVIKINDIRNLIYNEIDLQSAGALTSAMATVKSKHYRMFRDKKSSAHESLRMVAARTLMYRTMIADWNRAEVIVKKYPHLIFSKMPVLLDDQKTHMISALQYALYIGDYHSLVMFQKYLHGDVELVRQYQRQEIEQTLRLDHDAYLCRKYRFFIKSILKLHEGHSDKSYKRVQDYWYEQIAMAQHTLAWALREMCEPEKYIKIFNRRFQEKYKWSPDASFNNSRPSSACIATIGNVGSQIDIIEQRTKEGNFYPCSRWDADHAVTFIKKHPTPWEHTYTVISVSRVRFDLLCFANLFKQRNQMISQISLASDVAVGVYLYEWNLPAQFGYSRVTNVEKMECRIC